MYTFKMNTYNMSNRQQTYIYTFYQNKRIYTLEKKKIKILACVHVTTQTAASSVGGHTDNPLIKLQINT